MCIYIYIYMSCYAYIYIYNNNNNNNNDRTSVVILGFVMSLCVFVKVVSCYALSVCFSPVSRRRQ